jgi:hypothetical protein
VGERSIQLEVVLAFVSRQESAEGDDSEEEENVVTMEKKIRLRGS